MRPAIVVILAFLVLLVSGGITPRAHATANTESATTSWTLMMYMADDTTLAASLPWEQNLEEMQSAVQAPGTNIIALVDPLGENNSRLLKVLQDPNPPSTSIISVDLNDSGVVIPSGGEVNMALPNTLISFVDFAQATFPADRYVLDLWGHAAVPGWFGLCPDGTDILDLPELRGALDAIRITLGKPLDVVVVDACAEATLEFMDQIHSSVQYLVASESNVPSEGLPYTLLLNDLAEDTSQSPEEFGTAIARDYIAWSSAASIYSATMSVFNMSRVGTMIEKLDAFSAQGVKYDHLFHSALSDAFVSSQTYGVDWYFDFGDFVSNLQRSDVPLEMRLLAVEASQAYGNAISFSARYDNPDPYDGIGVSRATGAVIYAPSDQFPDTIYGTLAISSTSWDEFANLERASGSSFPSEAGPTVNTQDTDGDQMPDVATLAWSDAYDSEAAWVFRTDPSGVTFCENLESATPSIAVTGFAGALVIAASASVSGVAQSYSEVHVDLFGKVSLEVRLTAAGTVLVKGYEIRVTTSNATLTYQSDETGIFRFDLTVPQDAQAGELVRIDAIAVSGGRIVGSTWVFVPTDSVSTTLEVFDTPQKSSEFSTLIFLSVLPGLLVALFALLMYLELRKARRA